jgi:selenide,water dikinase
MGGEPQVALVVCGFPTEEVGTDILARVLKGGRDKAAEAGCALVGGHTVLDPEPKYGLCVVGTVDVDRAFSQKRARVGDRLVLTKPIGSGIAAQAIKKDELPDDQVDLLIRTLSTLNKGAKDAALSAGVRAATDVTGFGLLGHLSNMLMASGVSARIDVDEVPVYDFVPALAEQGMVPGGSRKNLAFVAESTHFDAAVSEVEQLILADAQTSGGLLIAVPAEQERDLLVELERQGTPARAVVGEITGKETGRIDVVKG